MGEAASASIDHLEATWASIVELCGDLTDEQWATPTGCPGWSVQDVVAHLIDYEAGALGRPRPDHVLPDGLAHIENPMGEINEVGVDFRRSRSGAEVLDELCETVAARHEQLLELTAPDLEEEVDTPAGRGTVQDLLTLRVMDTWAHEQDIRRALGRPGHASGPVVHEAVTYWSQYLPYVVGKRAGAPDGTTVVVDITGVDVVPIEVVDGRARRTDRAPDEPTVRLAMPATTFAALVGGRDDAPDDVDVSGDEGLGAAIVANLGFLP